MYPLLITAIAAVALIIGIAIVLRLQDPHPSRPPQISLRTLIIIVLILSALMGVAIRAWQRRKYETAAQAQLQRLTMALFQYRFAFPDYPPDTTPSGLTGSRALHYYLATAFSPTPDIEKNEVWANVACGPCMPFKDAELRHHTEAAADIVDPWGTPLIYRRPTEQGAQLYSCGPNGVDEGVQPGSDDVDLKEW